MDRIIDAHHHIWRPFSGPDLGYGWLRDIGAPKPFGDPTPIQRDYPIEEFLSEADPARLAASVHVQADPALPDPVAETAFVQAEADRMGHPVAIVGFADLTAPDLGEVLHRHMAYRSFRGVRQIVARLPDRPELNFAAGDLLRDHRFRDGLKQLQDNDLSFDLQVYPEQAEDLFDALEAVPDLTVIVDHAGGFWDRSEGSYARWLAAMRQLAERENTYVKLSGWGMYRPDWQPDDLNPRVGDLIALFHSSRVMWGSNYPVEKLVTPYPALLSAFRRAVGSTDHEDVFHRVAARVYRLTLDQMGDQPSA